MRRKPLPKSLRFEVFKRDLFQCRYCGRKAPDVVLEVDHIEACSKGGSDDILNLLTACFECNRGKRDKPLADVSMAGLQAEQIREAQSRNDQAKMLIQWRREIEALKDEMVDLLEERWCERFPGLSFSSHGRETFVKVVRRFDSDVVAEAVEICGDQYLRCDPNGNATQESFRFALDKLGGVCWTLTQRRKGA